MIAPYAAKSRDKRGWSQIPRDPLDLNRHRVRALCFCETAQDCLTRVFRNGVHSITMASYLERTITRGLKLPCSRLVIVRASAASVRDHSSCPWHRPLRPLVLSCSSKTDGVQPGLRHRFHSSSKWLKKGGSKASKKGGNDAPTAAASGEGDDPNDFSELQEAIAQAHTSFKEALSKLKPGGKFNPEVLESLRVHLDKDSKNAVRLSDLAQCIPRGRTLNVIAGEKEVCLCHFLIPSDVC